jgi:DNA-binding Xre family transcriptional regulator
MQEAFSRLKRVLDSQGLNTAELVRRVAEQGDRINAKSIYRLADPEEPLEKVDMRVIGAVCQALEIGIADILTFDEPTIVEDLGAAKQARMDALMTRHGARSGPGLTAAEMTELEKLVGEAEAIALGNARRLAARRRRLLRAPRRTPSATPPTQGAD